MSTTIYLVRHGESEANKRNAFWGIVILTLQMSDISRRVLLLIFLRAKLAVRMLFIPAIWQELIILRSVRQKSLAYLF